MFYSAAQTFVPWSPTTKEDEHLILHFKSDEPCNYLSDGTVSDNATTATKYFSLDIEIFCDRSMGVLDTAIMTAPKGDAKSDACHPKVEMRSLFGCKISKLETANVFFETYYWVFAIIFILFGTYNILYGGKMFRLTILLFGIVSTVTLVFFILFFLIEVHGLSNLMIWLCLLSSASLGAVIGYFMTRIIKVGV